MKCWSGISNIYFWWEFSNDYYVCWKFGICGNYRIISKITCHTLVFFPASTSACFPPAAVFRSFELDTPNFGFPFQQNELLERYQQYLFCWEFSDDHYVCWKFGICGNYRMISKIIQIFPASSSACCPPAAGFKDFEKFYTRKPVLWIKAQCESFAMAIPSFSTSNAGWWKDFYVFRFLDYDQRIKNIKSTQPKSSTEKLAGRPAVSVSDCCIYSR